MPTLLAVVHYVMHYVVHYVMHYAMQMPTLLAAVHWSLVSRTLALHVGTALEKR